MRRLLYGPIIALVVVLARSAMAAEPPPASVPKPAPEKQRTRQVKKLVQEAQDAVNVLDLGRARAIWTQIRELEHSQVAICTLGQLDVRLARWTDAAAELSQCFLEMRAPSNAQERMYYEQRRADLAAVRRHVGAVEVHVSDPGAEVLVDGRRSLHANATAARPSSAPTRRMQARRLTPRRLTSRSATRP